MRQFRGLSGSYDRIEAIMPGAASDDMKVSFEAAPAFVFTDT